MDCLTQVGSAGAEKGKDCVTGLAQAGGLAGSRENRSGDASERRKDE